MKKVLIVADMEANMKARESFFDKIKIDHIDAKKSVKGMDLHEALDEINNLKNKCNEVIYIIDEECCSQVDIAEVIISITKSPKSTSVAFLPGGNWYNVCMTEIMRMVDSAGATVLEHNLDAIADYINGLVVEIPFNPNVIECLIKRDGPTTMTLGKRRYTFDRNENDDVVCEVLAADHRNYLLSLPDFRVYQAEKLAPPEFTPEETDFHREWKTMSALRFNAYVNGNILRFRAVGQKMRDMAIMKWHGLLPKMPCPLEHQDFNAESPPALQTLDENSVPPNGPPVFESPHLSWEQEHWEAWHQSWSRLGFQKFKQLLEDPSNEEMLLAAPDDIYDKAEEKWKRLSAEACGPPWPYDDEDPEGTE